MSVEVVMLFAWLVGLPLVFISLVIIYPRYLRWRVSSQSRTRVVGGGLRSSSSSFMGAAGEAGRIRPRTHRDI